MKRTIIAITCMTLLLFSACGEEIPREDAETVTTVAASEATVITSETTTVAATIPAVTENTSPFYARYNATSVGNVEVLEELPYTEPVHSLASIDYIRSVVDNRTKMHITVLNYLSSITEGGHREMYICDTALYNAHSNILHKDGYMYLFDLNAKLYEKQLFDSERLKDFTDNYLIPYDLTLRTEISDEDEYICTEKVTVNGEIFYRECFEGSDGYSTQYYYYYFSEDGLLRFISKDNVHYLKSIEYENEFDDSIFEIPTDFKEVEDIN